MSTKGRNAEGAWMREQARLDGKARLDCRVERLRNEMACIGDFMRSNGKQPHPTKGKGRSAWATDGRTVNGVRIR